MICHSGGCDGADMEWETEAKKYNVKTISYSFHNHVQKGEFPVVLTQEELAEGFKHVKIAAETIHRPVESIQYPYVKNLLARNWYQVKNSDAVYAIGKFQSRPKNIVDGGTGWAVQMAIDSNKPVFFFDQKTNVWYAYNYTVKSFEEILGNPRLTKNFAGIGTRDITKEGKKAIKDTLYMSCRPTAADRLTELMIPFIGKEAAEASHPKNR